MRHRCCECICKRYLQKAGPLAVSLVAVLGGTKMTLVVGEGSHVGEQRDENIWGLGLGFFTYYQPFRKAAGVRG